VLATSNRNLREEVSAGRFRDDLFYRLNVFPLHITPICTRTDDIIPLANHMIERWSRNRVPKPELTDSAKECLLAHSWPGNVRELENVIQRALILISGATIDADAICFEVTDKQSPNNAVASVTKLSPGIPSSVSSFSSGGESENCPEQLEGKTAGDPGDLKSREQQLILEVLEAVKGSRKEAAERLGISPRTLRYKLARLRDAGIELP
jgi:two-component system response regulator FlrC